MASFFEMIPASLVQLTLAAMAIFIVLLVLVQRGRGGGLAGALGGPGGSSAFGAKAGDTFTKITIWVVSIWILTCLMASVWASNRGDAFGDDDAALSGDSITATDEDADAGGESPAAEADAGEPAEAEDQPADEEKPAAE